MPPFCTRWTSPEALALDAFAISWVLERAWINPPWDLLPRVLQKIMCEGASATIIAPRWEIVYWWPTLVDMAAEKLVFAPSCDSFLPGHFGSGAPSGLPRWELVAVRVAPAGRPAC